MVYKPLVSVIIPTYNRADVVLTSVDSVIGQTYDNIEIIVVDDGSNDNTIELLVTYKGKIRYLYKKNGGVSSARNLGIKESKGDYIAFLDSDDFWYADKIEKQVEQFIEDRDCAIVISNVETINERNQKTFLYNLKKDKINSGDFMLYFVKNPKITCSCLIFRKEVFDNVGLFDDGITTAEDIDILLRACSKYKAMFLDESLVKYMKREDSLSNQLFTKNRIKVINKIKEYNPSFFEKNKKIISKTIAKINLSYAEDLLWSKYIKEAQKQILESFRNYFMIKAVMLYAKSIAISIFSLVQQKYKDKGKFIDCE